MNLKFQSIHIDPDSPFDNDLLNRRGEIENLTELIRNVNSPAVLAIDSRWGTGKTTFIKLWEGYLKAEGIESLYFNAWATDFSEDPLVSFLGEMNSGLESLTGASKKSKLAWSKTKTIGKQIAQRGLPALIRIGTAGIIDTDKIVEDELSKAMELLAGDALEDYLRQKNAIAEFRDALKELIEIAPNDSPVVIFVDELDRCRPTYAISLLERIKHLFDIEGLVFVLALDKEQLGHSLSAVYGAGIDSGNYLRRFIDFEYHLKHPEIENYIDSLFSAFSLDEYFGARSKYRELQNDRKNLESVFLMLAKFENLSLREIEQLLASINLALRTAKENEFVHPWLLAFLVVIKNKQPGIYERYISETESEEEAIEYLYQTIPKETRYRNHVCAVVEAYLIAAKKDRLIQGDSALLTRHKAVLEDDNSSSEEKKYSDKVVNISEQPLSLGSPVNLSVLVERIELLSQFRFQEEKVDDDL